MDKDMSPYKHWKKFIAKSKSRKECELKLVSLSIYYFLVTETLAISEKIFCWMMAKQIS